MSHETEGGGISGVHVPGGAFSQIIGHSRIIRCLVEQARTFASSHSAVMIMGETGTGKEVFARAIHHAAARRTGPFIPVNCASFPAELVENELFGHLPGAFTGASRSHKGLVEQAHGGTLFLDENDSLAVAIQAKLLRFGQDHEYQPLGGEQLRHADVRIISATNADLEELVRSGRFREDLFYRICVLTLTLPPLRERREDIPLLANHLLLRHTSRNAEPGSPANKQNGHSPDEISGGRINGTTRKPEERSPTSNVHSKPLEQRETSKTPTFTVSALDKLANHDWPGNVRELENVIERAIVSAAGNVLDAQHIDFSAPVRPPTIDWRLTNSRPSVNGHETESYKMQKARAVSEFEEQFLRRALKEHSGNITKAAKAAGKDRRTFAQLLAKHHITSNHCTRDAGESGPMNSQINTPPPGNSSDNCIRLGRRSFGRPDRLP